MASEEKIQNESRGIVTLAANPEGIKAGVQAFTNLKNDLLKDHTMKISGNSYIKKSGWRIVALAFNLSDRIVSVEKKDLGNDDYVITYTVEVTAPNGRTAQGIGSCSTAEKAKSGDRKYHMADSHAHTRAKNRAISDLVGLGEVSAEEVDPEESAQGPTNFCKDTTHKHSIADQQANKCSTCGKMLRMP